MRWLDGASPTQWTSVAAPGVADGQRSSGAVDSAKLQSWDCFNEQPN